ncbi:MAG: YihY/virulence factor BrkB family protein [Porticoccaceae bacterium]
MQALRYWWQIVRDTVELWLKFNAFSYAGSLAFYTLFSLAPTVIIAVAVIGIFLGEDAAQGQIVGQLQDVMGVEAARAVEQAVSNSRIDQSGLFPTVAGIVALVVGATTVFAQMQYSLNLIWGVTAKPSRNNILIFLKKRFFSLMVVLAIGFVLLVSLLLGIFLRVSLDFTTRFLPLAEVLLKGSEQLISLLVIALLFAAMFKLLPDVVLSWRDVLLGAAVTAVLFSLGRYGIATYLAYTATASTYGAAGAVVLILLWVYYSSLILLFGAAFIKVHLKAKGKTIHPRSTAVFIDRAPYV